MKNIKKSIFFFFLKMKKFLFFKIFLSIILIILISSHIGIILFSSHLFSLYRNDFWNLLNLNKFKYYSIFISFSFILFIIFLFLIILKNSFKFFYLIFILIIISFFIIFNFILDLNSQKILILKNKSNQIFFNNTNFEKNYECYWENQNKFLQNCSIILNKFMFLRLDSAKKWLKNYSIIWIISFLILIPNFFYFKKY